MDKNNSRNPKKSWEIEKNQATYWQNWQFMYKAENQLWPKIKNWVACVSQVVRWLWCGLRVIPERLMVENHLLRFY